MNIKRFDVNYNQPFFKDFIKKLRTSKNITELGTLIGSWDRGDGPRTGFYTDDEINGVAFLRVNNLKEHSIDVSDVKYINREVHEITLKRTQVTAGDVIFAVSGTKDNLGTVSVVPSDIKEANLNSALVRLNINEEQINKTFFCYFFDLNISRIQIEYIGKGAAQNNLNGDEIGEILIPLPPLPIQEKLVEEMERARESRRRKLSEADALLSTLDGWLLDTLGITPPPEDNRKVFAVLLNELNNRLDVHANQSRFRELFKRLNEMPFQVLPLSQLTTNIFSGTTPKVGSDAYVEPPNGIAFVRSGEIGKDGVVTVSNEIHISNETHNKKMKSSQLKRDDVLVAIVGATIGNVGVFDSDEPANINQAIASVRINGAILPKYLVCYLKSKLGQQVLDYLKRPVARANINLDEIGSILVPVVSKELQETIVDKFNGLRDESQRLKAEAESEWQAAKDWFEAQLLGE